MGYIEKKMDSAFLIKTWGAFGFNVSAKVIVNKFNASHDYAFIEFNTHEEAERALSLNDQNIPGSQSKFVLNWSTGGQIEPSVFVGDLSPSITDEDLHNLFSHYQSLKSVKIVRDSETGASKGYGFVRFNDSSEVQRCLYEMQGVFLVDRPIRVSVATPKQQKACYLTTIFVGALPKNVDNAQLASLFAPFGEIVHTRIGNSCGFVQFANRYAAQNAIDQMDGYQLGTHRLRLSWGKSQIYHYAYPPSYPTIPVFYPYYVPMLPYAYEPQYSFSSPSDVQDATIDNTPPSNDVYVDTPSSSDKIN